MLSKSDLNPSNHVFGQTKLKDTDLDDALNPLDLSGTGKRQLEVDNADRNWKEALYKWLF